MKHCVVDASIILSIFLERDKKTFSEYRRLISLVEKRKVKLWAPDYMLFEVANVLGYSKEEKWKIFTIWDLIRKAPIKYIGHNELNSSFFPSIALLSRKLGTSFYDTYYHYLAMIMEGTFLTRDKKYYQKAKKLGNIKCL